MLIVKISHSAADLFMFLIGRMLQAPPLSCERAHSWIDKPWVDL